MKQTLEIIPFTLVVDRNAARTWPYCGVAKRGEVYCRPLLEVSWMRPDNDVGVLKQWSPLPQAFKPFEYEPHLIPADER